MAHGACLALAVLVASGAARAAGPDAQPGKLRSIVWLCDDEALAGTGFPGCDDVAQSLRIELAGAAISVVDHEASPAGGPGQAAIDPFGIAASHGALFVAWIEPGPGGAGFVLHAFDALNGQVLSKPVVPDGDGAASPGVLDADSIAFLYRNMLGTSLYADLDTIGSEAGLLTLAFPEEKVEIMKKAVGIDGDGRNGQVPSWLRVSILYDPILYPADLAVWHAVAVDLGFRLHRFVELSIVVAVSPAPLERRAHGVGLDLRLVPIHLGLRIPALEKGRISLLPGLGLGLTVSSAVVSGGVIDGSGERGRVDLHGSAFVSLLVRIWLHRRMGIAAEVGAEFLSDQHAFCVESDPAADAACSALYSPGVFGMFFRFGIAFR